MKILYFEDTPRFYAMYKTALEKAGFEVIHFEYPPKDVVEKVLEIKPDIILTDIMMPEMNGFEMGQRVLEDDRTKDVPIFALSSMAIDEYKQKGMMIGLRDYWFKNENPPKIVAENIKNFLK
ncbi:response regulator [Patescibacteria group bacterium]|nr:response regulator [Patescibacteria group bacterium]MBU1673896.1 response regulator [Patescibacteria group bacterium]MBU1963431.1 response regulator [Patescibacteria group bacterium]